MIIQPIGWFGSDAVVFSALKGISPSEADRHIANQPAYVKESIEKYADFETLFSAVSCQLSVSVGWGTLAHLGRVMRFTDHSPITQATNIPAVPEGFYEDGNNRFIPDSETFEQIIVDDSVAENETAGAILRSGASWGTANSFRGPFATRTLIISTNMWDACKGYRRAVKASRWLSDEARQLAFNIWQGYKAVAPISYNVLNHG